MSKDLQSKDLQKLILRRDIQRRDRSDAGQMAGYEFDLSKHFLQMLCKEI